MKKQKINTKQYSRYSTGLYKQMTQSYRENKSELLYNFKPRRRHDVKKNKENKKNIKKTCI